MLRASPSFASLALVLALALLALPLLAVADGHGGGEEVDPNIQYRQKVMDTIGANMGAISDIMKHRLDRPGAIANHADQMADAAKLIAAAFREPVSEGPTDAKPKIWKDWAKFESAASDYEEAARALEQAASGGDASAVGAAVKALGKSCGGCHKPFRKPKEESYKRR